MLVRMFYAILFSTFYVMPIQAETYIREYTYTAFEADSKYSCRTIAIDQVKSLLLQELGTHIIQRFNVRKSSDGSVYASEDVIAITAGFVSLEILEEIWDGHTYYMKASLEADSNNIIKSVNELAKNDSYALDQLIDERGKKEEALREIKRLKNELVKAVSLNDKALLEKNYNEKIYDLENTDKFLNAWRLSQEGKYQIAFKLYSELARDGHAIAQNNLGSFYERGSHVDKDYKMAQHWYQRAAEQNLPIAQINLAGLYMTGPAGVPKSLKDAYYWVEKAALQGDPMGQFTMGALYSLGLGVDIDAQETFYWYRKAAENGLAIAQFKIATMYEDGVGVARNQSKADKWYTQAKKRGIDSVDDMLKEIKRMQN